MKKLVLLVLCLIINGCVILPNYVSHTQEIDLTEFQKQNPNAKIYYNDEEQTDKVELFRSWFDKELVIKKDGFKDYHLKLESEWTGDDPWAWGINITQDEKISANNALSFHVTRGYIKNNYKQPLVMLYLLPFGLFFDSILFAEGVLVSPINPWKEYENENIERKDNREEWILNYASIILEPTDELKQSCTKKGYFISNLGCTKCSYEDTAGVVASDEELKRCSNRFKGKNNISYICTNPNPIDADMNECAKCSNRKMLDDLCMIKCPADRPLQSASGHCYSCDSQNAVYLNEKECKECPTRYFTNGRCEKCHSGVVSADGNECIHY